MRTLLYLFFMRMKTTAFRASIYKVLDRLEETGDTLEIERKGKLFRIELVKDASKLDRLVKREIMSGDPEEIVSNDWSHMWRNGLP